jgi:hypothetical protein
MKYIYLLLILLCVSVANGYVLVEDSYTCNGTVTIIGSTEVKDNLQYININGCEVINSIWVCRCVENKLDFKIETTDTNSTFKFKTNYTVPRNGSNVSLIDLYRYKSYENLKVEKEVIVVPPKGQVTISSSVIVISLFIAVTLIVVIVFIILGWLNSEAKPLKVERNIQTIKKDKVVNYQDEFKRILENGKK